MNATEALLVKTLHDRGCSDLADEFAYRTDHPEESHPQLSRIHFGNNKPLTANDLVREFERTGQHNLARELYERIREMQHQRELHETNADDVAFSNREDKFFVPSGIERGVEFIPVKPFSPEENETWAAISDVTVKIQTLDRRGVLKQNKDELAKAINVLQQFPIQHMLHRIWPNQFSDWYAQ